MGKEAKLHADLLTEKYGPIHSEVLRHDDFLRESHLVDESGISRTYALTLLTFDRSNREIIAIDEKIKNGGLMGSAFRDHGYKISKKIIAENSVDLSENLQARMNTKGAKTKAKLYELYVSKGEQNPVMYGIVLEIYPPDFDPSN